MDEALFKELISKNESKTLDFKSQFYTFTEGAPKERKVHENSEFIKDIIAFNNTIRDEESYILFGVQEETDGTKNLIGIDHFDNASLVEKIKDVVYPMPDFVANTFMYEGTRFGYIKIPLPKYTQPSIPIKDYGKLKKDSLLIRHNSSTKEADSAEKEKIYAWLSELSEKRRQLRNSIEELESLIDEVIQDDELLIKALSIIYAKGEGLGMNVEEVDLLIERRKRKRERTFENVGAELKFFVILIILLLSIGYCTIEGPKINERNKIIHEEKQEFKRSISELLSRGNYQDARIQLETQGNIDNLLADVYELELAHYIETKNIDNAVFLLNFIRNKNDILEFDKVVMNTTQEENEEIRWKNKLAEMLILHLLGEKEPQKAENVLQMYIYPEKIPAKDGNESKLDFSKRDGLIRMINQFE